MGGGRRGSGVGAPDDVSGVSGVASAETPHYLVASGYFGSLLACRCLLAARCLQSVSHLCKS